jgi:hypothetical protein
MKETKKQILEGIEDLILKAKRVDNNTYEVNYKNEDKAIRLHHTDVVTVKPNGDMILDSGGWKTPTTKARISRFSKLHMLQKDFVWYVGKEFGWKINSPTFPMVEFYDGITFNKKGNVKRVR